MHWSYHSHQDDVIKWKLFPRYWAFVREIHRSPVNSPHKGQWRGALMFSLIYAWISGRVNNGEAGDLRCHNVHYDVIAMICVLTTWISFHFFSLFSFCLLTLNMQRPSYFGLTRSISWFLMPCLLASPGHQQPWYWLRRIGRSLSYLRKDFNYLCHINVVEWHKM